MLFLPVETVAILTFRVRLELGLLEIFVSGIVLEVVRNVLKTELKLQCGMSQKSCGNTHGGGKTCGTDAFSFYIGFVIFD